MRTLIRISFKTFEGLHGEWVEEERVEDDEEEPRE